MIPTEFQWLTQDGRILDIRWMDSKHLVHSMNMLMRQNGIGQYRIAKFVAAAGAKCLYEELQARGLWNLQEPQPSDGSAPAQLIIDTAPREDFKTMCMLRAMIDTGEYGPATVGYDADIWTLRMRDDRLDQVLREAEKRPTRNLRRLITKFTEYRLAGPVNTP